MLYRSFWGGVGRTVGDVSDVIRPSVGGVQGANSWKIRDDSGGFGSFRKDVKF